MPLIFKKMTLVGSWCILLTVWIESWNCFREVMCSFHSMNWMLELFQVLGADAFSSQYEMSLVTVSGIRSWYVLITVWNGSCYCFRDQELICSPHSMKWLLLLFQGSGVDAFFSQCKLNLVTVSGIRSWCVLITVWNGSCYYFRDQELVHSSHSVSWIL